MRYLHQGGEQQMTAEQLKSLSERFERVCADIGTGDGKRLYRVAKADPKTLYVGIDPVKDNMLETAKKAAKKPAKGGLENLLLVVGAVEALPNELDGHADEVTVYFPWGSLLEAVVKPVPDSLAQIKRIAKQGAQFTFITTYQESYEAHEIEKRGLPELSMDYFETQHKSALAENGFLTENVTELTPEDVKALGTQWAKRLGTGRARKYFKISGVINA